MRRSAPGPGEHRGRQVHDLPHHGARRRGRRLARPALRDPASHTEDLPLLGAVGSGRPAGGRGATPAPPACRRCRWTTWSARYGTLALRVLDLVAEDPALVRAARRRGRLPGRRGPVRRAARGGAARGRRAHAPHAHRVRGAGPRTARRRGRGSPDGAGPRVGRGAVDHEIEHYRSRLDAESAAQKMLDDAAADAARAPVRDVRLEHEAGRAPRG